MNEMSSLVYVVGLLQAERRMGQETGKPNQTSEDLRRRTAEEEPGGAKAEGEQETEGGERNETRHGD